MDTPPSPPSPNPDMSLFSKRLFVTCALLAVAAAVPAEELSGTGSLLDRVAAVVNDGIVLQSDLDQQTQVIASASSSRASSRRPRNVLRQQVLERLVLQELQMQRADRLGIQVTDEMLNTALTDVAQRNNIKFSDLPAALEQQGVDYRAYREEMRREMTMTALRQRDVYSRIFVSPREVEQCVAKRKGSPAETQEFNLAHILVAIPESATHRAGGRARGARRGRVRARPIGRGLRAARDRLLRCRHGARGRRARLAQGRAAALLRRRSHPGDAARAGDRADPLAERSAPLQAARGARRRAGRTRLAGPCAAHPARDQRDRGRRDGAPEARRRSASGSSVGRASRRSRR